MGKNSLGLGLTDLCLCKCKDFKSDLYNVNGGLFDN